MRRKMMSPMQKTSLCVVFAAVALLAGVTAAGEWRLNQSNNLVDSFTQDYDEAVRDRAVGRRPLIVAGVEYKDGVGTFANSQTYILLDGRAASIKGLAGADDRGGERGSVFFSIVDCDTFGTLWESDLLRAGDKAVPFDVPLAGVKRISLRVADSGDGNHDDFADWLDVRIGYQGKKPVLVDALSEPMPAGKVWQLNREPMNLFVQEYDEARRDASVGGGHLSVAGFRYNEGVGTFANGEAYIRLDGSAKRMTGRAGVDDRADGRGSVVFRIIDAKAGRTLWDSKLMRTGEYAKAFDVALDGVGTLCLQVTDAGDGTHDDFADWLDVRIEYEGAEPGLVAKSDAVK